MILPFNLTPCRSFIIFSLLLLSKGIVVVVFALAAFANPAHAVTDDTVDACTLTLTLGLAAATSSAQKCSVSFERDKAKSKKQKPSMRYYTRWLI